MDREAVVKEMNGILNPDLLSITSIESVNFKPHPYTIGPKHLERNDSMYLGESQIEQMERQYGPMCAQRGCNFLYHQHTCDTVAFVQLHANVDSDMLRVQLKKIVELCEQNKVDGFAFLDTPEHYRVIQPEGDEKE